jgi:hypothetical protein
MTHDADSGLLQRLVRAALVPGKDAGERRTRRVHLFNVGISPHWAIPFFLVHGVVQLFDGLIKATPLPPSHSSTNQLSIVAREGEDGDIVPLYGTVDFEEQPVCDLVVLGSAGLPELEPVAGDDSADAGYEAAESHEFCGVLSLVAHLICSFMVGTVAGYACSWIKWKFFT